MHYVYGIDHMRQAGRLNFWRWLLALTFMVSAALLIGARLLDTSVQPSEHSLPSVSIPNLQTEIADYKKPPEINSDIVEQSILTWLNKHSDHNWSISVMSLDDGSFVSTDTQTFPPASLYKLLILPEFFAKYNLSDLDKMEIEDQSLRKCFDKMLLHSDNDCGSAIANKLVGWQQADERLTSLGFDGISLNDPQGMTIVSEDMSRFMADLYQSRLTSPEERDYIFDLLGRQIFRSGIPEGCNECRVMNKTGDNTVRNDVAIVEVGTKTYALTILSDGGSYTEVADVSRVVLESIKSGQGYYQLLE